MNSSRTPRFSITNPPVPEPVDSRDRGATVAIPSEEWRRIAARLGVEAGHRADVRLVSWLLVGFGGALSVLGPLVLEAPLLGLGAAALTAVAAVVACGGRSARGGSERRRIVADLDALGDALSERE